MHTVKAPVKPELAQVFSYYGDQYRATHKLPALHRKVMFAIESCRTAVLGGHSGRCNECGKEQIWYNSCRNRHCPKCQQLKKRKWVEKLSASLLPVRHFHLVFTIPSELNRLCLSNQEVMYGILFRAASQTILTLARDARHLGAETGLVAILHTWGQTLAEHPHLHVLVPAGGWNTLNGYWKSSRKKFFLPVKVMSALFRGKFLANLKMAFQVGELKLEGVSAVLRNEATRRDLLRVLYAKQWVVYSKAPFKNAGAVINYLGRYTHRVALTNDRLQSIDDGTVSFSWKDYRDKSQRKIMRLDAKEFIRRFLLHVLPRGFCKIRYYGLLASRNHSLLQKYRRLMGFRQQQSRLEGLSWNAATELVFGWNPLRCPFCGQGTLVVREIPALKRRAP